MGTSSSTINSDAHAPTSTHKGGVAPKHAPTTQTALNRKLDGKVASPSAMKDPTDPFDPMSITPTNKKKSTDQAIACAPSENSSCTDVGTRVQAPIANPYRKQLVTFYKKYDPRKLPEIDQILSDWKGVEEDLLAVLRSHYRVDGYKPPENMSEASQGSPYDRAEAWRKFRRARMEKKLLQNNGGPEASDIQSTRSVSIFSVNSIQEDELTRDEWFDRLSAFFKKYQKNRVHLVGIILDKADGREVEIMHRLVDNYGREPAPYCYLFPAYQQKKSKRKSAAASHLESETDDHRKESVTNADTVTPTVANAPIQLPILRAYYEVPPTVLPVLRAFYEEDPYLPVLHAYEEVPSYIVLDSSEDDDNSIELSDSGDTDAEKEEQSCVFHAKSTKENLEAIPAPIQPRRTTTQWWEKKLPAHRGGHSHYVTPVPRHPPHLTKTHPSEERLPTKSEPVRIHNPRRSTTTSVSASPVNTYYTTESNHTKPASFGVTALPIEQETYRSASQRDLEGIRRITKDQQKMIMERATETERLRRYLHDDILSDRHSNVVENHVDHCPPRESLKLRTTVALESRSVSPEPRGVEGKVDSIGNWISYVVHSDASPDQEKGQRPTFDRTTPFESDPDHQHSPVTVPSSLKSIVPLQHEPLRQNSLHGKLQHPYISGKPVRDTTTSTPNPNSPSRASSLWTSETPGTHILLREQRRATQSIPTYSGSPFVDLPSPPSSRFDNDNENENAMVMERRTDSHRFSASRSVVQSIPDSNSNIKSRSSIAARMLEAVVKRRSTYTVPEESKPNKVKTLEEMRAEYERDRDMLLNTDHDGFSIHSGC